MYSHQYLNTIEAKHIIVREHHRFINMDRIKLQNHQFRNNVICDQTCRKLQLINGFSLKTNIAGNLFNQLLLFRSVCVFFRRGRILFEQIFS